jgi:ankyrin repeat protein
MESDLIEAASCGDIDQVRDLIAKGANVRACDDYALRCSVLGGHVDVVRMLLAAGANVRARRNEAMRRAAKNRRAAIVRELLLYGAMPTPEALELIAA